MSAEGVGRGGYTIALALRAFPSKCSLFYHAVGRRDAMSEEREDFFCFGLAVQLAGPPPFSLHYGRIM